MSGFALFFALVALDPDLAALRVVDQRVADISHRLQTTNTALCPGQVRALPGFTVQTAGQFAPSDRARVQRQLGAGPRAAVGVVATGSDAARVGLRAGDVLLAINGADTPAETPGRYAQAAATEQQIDDALLDPPVRLTLGDRQVVLRGDTGCATRAQVIDGGLQATAADGRYVQISQAMIRFAASDDALAAVAAHELAHNILRHAARRTPSRQAEYEADWLSVWLMARAGYDVDAIVPFWTRLGRRTDYGIFSDGTHPSWRKRVARLEAAVALVKAQRASGAALVPPAHQQSASQAVNPR
jgi:beta-barrel assembly-enhancing protease